LRYYIIPFIIALSVSACNLQRNPSTSSQVQAPTVTNNENPVLVQETVATSDAPNIEVQTPAEESSDWQIVEDGLAWRTVVPDGNTFAQMNILRIDPERFRFRAVYQAGNPLSLRQWNETLPDAVALVNANFFERGNTVLGVLVSDGMRFGETFRRTGGTFIVENGVPSIRSNQTQPYQGQPVEQAVEGFPLLVADGQSVHYSNNRAQRTRRTVIAQDSDGHILLMVSPFLGLSLTDLSLFLPTSDLNIVHALNLDGGGSTMMSVQPTDYTLGAFDPVPAVLAVYRR